MLKYMQTRIHTAKDGCHRDGDPNAHARTYSFLHARTHTLKLAVLSHGVGNFLCGRLLVGTEVMCVKLKHDAPTETKINSKYP